MDKTVRFNIEIESNGHRVIQQVSADADELREALEGVTRSGKEAVSALEGFGGLTLVMNSAIEIVDRLKTGVDGLADEWNKFDTGMRAVNTMAGKSKEELAGLTEEVEALAGWIPKAKDELAGGLYQVISNGVPEDNWISFLEDSAKASVGGIADLGQTVTVTSTIIKNYGMAWDEAGAIQDKIQKTAQNGVTSFEQLAAALPRVTGTAATLGVTIDELMASFATLTGVSGNTAEVSTQLAAIFTALVKPSSEAASMATQMGIQFDAAAIKAAGGMSNFLQQLDRDVKAYAAAHGMLEQEIYGKLFGSAESLRALTALTGELADKFESNVEAMADSEGTIDQAFDEMAGSGEAVTQMLKNQWSTMLGWAGSVASSIQPYLTFVAVGGQAIIGFTMLRKSVLVAVGAIKTFTAAQKSSAAASVIVATHEKIQTVARNMLTAATGTATVGTTALTVATIALYAALTMGISVIITGLCSLFSSLGDEAEEASEDVDILKESTDAFSNTVSNVTAEIEMEKRKLLDLIKTNKDAKDTIEDLNNKYGEAFGCHQTAADWYDTLVAKSKIYCQQLGYEAQAKVLASQKAAKELQKDNLMHEINYLGQTYWDGNGDIHYNWELHSGGARAGKEYYDSLITQLQVLNGEISVLDTQFNTCIDRMADAQRQLTATTNTTTQAVDWQTMSYTDLGKAIEQQKIKVAGLAGVNEAEARREAQKLQQMQSRYKALGKTYGLTSSTSHTTTKDKYSGKTLIEDAKTYNELGNNIKYYQNQLDNTAPSEEAEIRRLTGLIQGLQDQQAAIKALYDAIGRPVSLETLEDIDKEIAYQNGLRGKATQEQLGRIDEELRKLQALKDAYELESHIPLQREEIRTWQELSGEISYWEKRLKSCTVTERGEIQKQIESLRELQDSWDDIAHEDKAPETIKTYRELDAEISYYEGKLKRVGVEERAEVEARLEGLRKLKKAWDAQSEAMHAPGDIGALATVEELEEAISWYQGQMRRGTAEEIEAIQRTVTALEKKRDALQRLATIPKQQAEIAELGELSGKKLKIELEAIGIEGIKGKIRELQRLLDDTKNPLGEEQRKEVTALVGQWKQYEKQLRRSQIKISDAWGSIKGISGGIEGLSETLRGNGTVWEKVTGTVDAALEVYEGVKGVTELIGLLTTATTAHTAAKTAEGAAEATTAGIQTAAATETAAEAAVLHPVLSAETSWWAALAAAKTYAAHAWIPFAGTAIASAMVATQQGVIVAASIPKFADGAIAYGPTLGIFGEYAGAAHNPEVVAPLDKLKGLLGGGGTHVEFEPIEFRLRAGDLYGTLKQRVNKMTRSNKTKTT